MVGAAVPVGAGSWAGDYDRAVRLLVVFLLIRLRIFRFFHYFLSSFFFDVSKYPRFEDHVKLERRLGMLSSVLYCRCLIGDLFQGAARVYRGTVLEVKRKDSAPR